MADDALENLKSTLKLRSESERNANIIKTLERRQLMIEEIITNAILKADKYTSPDVDEAWKSQRKNIIYQLLADV